jgi:hypothetical protein
VSDFDIAPGAPAEFVRAATSLLAANIRAEVSVEIIPSPTRVAPHSAAIAGEVLATGNSESLHGTGRLILMHDPDQIAAWGGVFRIVCFADVALRGVILWQELRARKQECILTAAGLRCTGAVDEAGCVFGNQHFAGAFRLSFGDIFQPRAVNARRGTGR